MAFASDWNEAKSGLLGHTYKRYVPCIQYANSLHKFQVFCVLFYWLCLHSYEMFLPLSYGRSDPTPSTNVRSTERQMWSRGSQIHQVWAQIICASIKNVPILQFTIVVSWNYAQTSNSSGQSVWTTCPCAKWSWATTKVWWRSHQTLTM